MRRLTDDDRRRRQTSATVTSLPPTLYVGGPVIRSSVIEQGRRDPTCRELRRVLNVINLRRSNQVENHLTVTVHSVTQKPNKKLSYDSRGTARRDEQTYDHSIYRASIASCGKVGKVQIL